jgi:hypothetical protein
LREITILNHNRFDLIVETGKMNDVFLESLVLGAVLIKGDEDHRGEPVNGDMGKPWMKAPASVKEPTAISRQAREKRSQVE